MVRQEENQVGLVMAVRTAITSPTWFSSCLTRPAGFEPATPALEERCSNPLSYERIVASRSTRNPLMLLPIIASYGLIVNPYEP